MMARSDARAQQSRIRNLNLGAKSVDSSSPRVRLAAGPVRTLQRPDIHERVHVHECPNRSRRRCRTHALRPPVLQGLESWGLRGCLGHAKVTALPCFTRMSRGVGFLPGRGSWACRAGCSWCGGSHSRGRGAPLFRRTRVGVVGEASRN